ncbi:MAG TPA: sialidase family protein, partial [Verrucomicrobiae bacterium]|nr:sialidase family protein [Verrucomicrobiae bacterium]
MAIARLFQCEFGAVVKSCVLNIQQQRRHGAQKKAIGAAMPEDDNDLDLDWQTITHGNGTNFMVSKSVFDRFDRAMIRFLFIVLALAGNNALIATENPPATQATVADAFTFPRLPMERHLTLAPGNGNPRNSEGDFIRLKDGRWLFIYTHFTTGSDDHAQAHLASRESRDGGRSWSEQDEIVVPNEGGFNVMSVSLLRLQTGGIALFYLRKNSLQDCRPAVRFSRDEAKTWSDPVECITDEVGYYVLNNNRVIQLKNGRLLLPVARHPFSAGKLG